MKDEKRKYYKRLIRKCNFDKLSTKSRELLEIINKLEFYMIRTTKWYKKILYKIICYLTAFLTNLEIKNDCQNAD